MFDVIPTNGQTWLVCGGRDFTDADAFDDFMGRLIRMRGIPAKIVHGAAKGADTLADAWAQRHALDVVRVQADWKAHGRAAGPRRNQQMIDQHRPDFVVAFPGGRGTDDMVRRAEDADITVAQILRTQKETA